MAHFLKKIKKEVCEAKIVVMTTKGFAFFLIRFHGLFVLTTRFYVAVF